MPPTEIFDLPLALQTTLGGGYLAYVTAYAGYRKDHGAEDAVFITLAFGLVAWLGFLAGQLVGWPLAILGGVGAALVAGVAWRRKGRDWWLLAMSALGVHDEDGVHSGWTAFSQAKHTIHQAAVYTTEGRVLLLENHHAHHAAPWSGLYLGGDGSVIMVVDGEERDGKYTAREDVEYNWGTRMTFVPASQIARVELRMLPKDTITLP